MSTSATYRMSELTKRPRFSGSALCATSAVLLLVALLSAWSLLTNYAVAGDFESGTHSAHTTAIGVLALANTRRVDHLAGPRELVHGEREPFIGGYRRQRSGPGVGSSGWLNALWSRQFD